MPGKVASRYARAIVDYLGTDAKVRKAAEEMQGFAEVVSGNEELKRVLGTELFTVKQRRAVVEDLAKHLKLSEDTRKILIQVTELKRINHLAGIVEAVHTQMLLKADVVPLKVESAGKLTADDKKLIETKFARVLDKKVEATYLVNPLLLGGVRVSAGSQTFDGSLQGGLSTIEETLIGGSI